MKRHYTKADEQHPGRRSVMRRVKGGADERVVSLSPQEAKDHAASLNQNDEDDLRKYGSYQN